jgi:hypothetical protein
MLVCASAMAARHPLIMLPDVVYGTYFINFFVLILFLLTLTAGNGNKKFCRVFLLLLFTAVILRLGSEWAGDRFAPNSISFPGYNSGQPILKDALRDPGFNEKRYCLPLRMEIFLDFCRKNLLTKP